MAQGDRAVRKTSVSEAGGAEAAPSPGALTPVPEAFQTGLHSKSVPRKSNIPKHKPSPVRFPHRPRTQTQAILFWKHARLPHPDLGKPQDTVGLKWGKTTRHFFQLFFQWQGSNSLNICTQNQATRVHDCSQPTFSFFG